MSSTIAASMATSGMLAAVTAAKLETDTPCAALRASRSAKDSVDELRAFLPDPQLRRRLGESELQLLTLVAQPPFGLRQPTIGAGSERSIPALPASRNWSRQLPTVAEDTPWRRAASASDSQHDLPGLGCRLDGDSMLPMAVGRSVPVPPTCQHQSLGMAKSDPTTTGTGSGSRHQPATRHLRRWP